MSGETKIYIDFIPKFNNKNFIVTSMFKYHNNNFSLLYQKQLEHWSDLFNASSDQIQFVLINELKSDNESMIHF